VLLLCVCGGFGVAFIFGSEGRNDAAPRPAVARTTPALPPRATEPASAKPTLRPVPARKIVGSTYAAGDDTYTMGFTGWPFAFRTPGSWGCVAGKVDLPQAKAWVCIDEGHPGNGQRMQVLLRPCPASCGQSERAKLNTDWFDKGAKAKAYDKDTSYVETAKDAKGRYALDMSHYFEDGASTWQVGVGGYSPPATRAAIQKTVNDVLSQTS